MDKVDFIKSTTIYLSPLLQRKYSRLNNLIKDKMDGFILRSKAQFVEKGETLY